MAIKKRYRVECLHNWSGRLKYNFFGGIEYQQVITCSLCQAKWYVNKNYEYGFDPKDEPVVPIGKLVEIKDAIRTTRK